MSARAQRRRMRRIVSAREPSTVLSNRVSFAAPYGRGSAAKLGRAAAGSPSRRPFGRAYPRSHGYRRETGMYWNSRFRPVAQAACARCGEATITS